MSDLLTHLRSGWAVDQAILSEEVRRERVQSRTHALSAPAASDAQCTSRHASHASRRRTVW